MSDRIEPCEYRDEAGRCKKREYLSMHSKEPIRPVCSMEEFTEELDITDREAVCQKESFWGNFHFAITEEQIEALKAGKVLYFVDEYGFFIAMGAKNGH